MDVFGSISLVDGALWLAVVAAMLSQLLQFNETLRRLSLAAVNIGFLYWLLGSAVWVPVALITFCWLISCSFSFGDSIRQLGCIFALVVLFTLFVDYRVQMVHQQLFPEFAAIGFAYIFLRAIDMLLQCQESREATTLPSCVNYLVPFHMLAAGPILSWRDFRNHDRLTDVSSAQVLQAAERIATGMFKKYVLSYAIQTVFLTGFQTSGTMFVIEVHMFYIWLFLDFSGYSDIAIGIGTLIGVHTPENFNRPFLARNLIDFWERWHITLSQFLRRNVYIPLQMHLLRKTGGKAAVRISIFTFCATFAASGLWHSFAPGFLLWALAHAIGVSGVVCYRHVLKRWLGTKRLKTYQASPFIRVVATTITFEYVAWTLIPIVVTGSW
jgi:D-alanyl-lipoteichoic acid acyltransferase DltB (MBOAT superfamily)